MADEAQHLPPPTTGTSTTKGRHSTMMGVKAPVIESGIFPPIPSASVVPQSERRASANTSAYLGPEDLEEIDAIEDDVQSHGPQRSVGESSPEVDIEETHPFLPSSGITADSYVEQFRRDETWRARLERKLNSLIKQTNSTMQGVLARFQALDKSTRAGILAGGGAGLLLVMSSVAVLALGTDDESARSPDPVSLDGSGDQAENVQSNAAASDELLVIDEPPARVAEIADIQAHGRQPESPQSRFELEDDDDEQVAAKIRRAISRRKVRTLDNLLVLPSSAKTVRSYSAGTKHCEDQARRGLGEWRLPTIGDLASMGDARLISKRKYWSSVPGDAAKRRMLVWDGKRSRVLRQSRGSRSIRAVCVRTR